MAISKYESFLGIKQLNLEAKSFVVRSLNFHWLFTFFSMLTTTFFILFALDLVSYSELGILLTIEIIIQLVIDYPSGVISDWIGQKWVFVSVSTFYFFGYLFLALATDFSFLLVAFILIALASSQESGAFDAWFDNNYKAYAPEDSERKVYIELKAKIKVLLNIIMALTFIIGGILVSILEIRNLFIIQALIIGSLAFLALKIIINNPKIEKVETKLDFSSYFDLLIDGVKVVSKHPILRLVIVGIAIYTAGLAIWFNFMLFPIYELYGKSPEKIGFMRAAIWWSAAFITIYFGIISRKIRNIKTWMVFFAITQSIISFGSFYLALTIFPYTTEFNWISYIAIIIIFTIATLPSSFLGILISRLYLDLIPDKNRNGIYSLIPTVISIGAVFTILIGGYMIEQFSYTDILLFLIVLGFSGNIVLVSGLLKYTPSIDFSEREVSDRIVLPNQVITEVQLLLPYSIPSSWKLHPVLQDAWNDLVSTALTDSEISNEEKELISTILSNLTNYAKILEDAVADNVITSKEQKKLVSARKSIWKKAFKQAISEDGISNEENELLFKLINILRSLEDFPKK
ncbi:MAG: MFS transporter [Candidatus Hodarchaeales archaeon]|jgi:MFS family permease